MIEITLNKLIDLVVNSEITWQVFHEKFSAVYQSEANSQVFERLSQPMVDYYDQIDNIIEYTDDNAESSERLKYGFTTPVQSVEQIKKLKQNLLDSKG